MNVCKSSILPDATISRRQILIGAAAACCGFATSPMQARAEGDSGISHSAEAIHQEPVLNASCARVYAALTETKRFDAATQFSGAMKSGKVAGGAATKISREVGGAFALFGGYITGRHIELVANARIVQAWRAGSWPPGIYSIARFELVEVDASTKILFDHTGFPAGQAEHLAAGWNENYWQPLAKYLA